MNAAFQRQHLAMLFKYAGISFISGAVNHGFFSGERSLWTAACGIVLFVAGAWAEHRAAERTESSGLARTLAWGTLLSIGLGFFTGGLQHFPDSPQRSAWVVPLGFALSAVALAATGSFAWKGGAVAYAAAGALLVTAGSAGAWQWLDANAQHAAAPHGHEDHASATAPQLQAQIVTRSVEVAMDDTMRFTPSKIDAQPGETLRIMARNAGKVEHELVIGDEPTIREHAEAMQHGGDHAHGMGAAIRVRPGQSGELVVTFGQAAVLQMACLVPGHYEAGMRGTLTVGKAG